MSNQVSTRLVSIPDTRTIQTLWHVHLLTVLTVFLCIMSVSQPILRNWVIQNWFCSYRRIPWKKTESKKKAESAGDDWRYTKGHLNPYYSWYQKGETLFSPLYWVHFVVTPFDYKDANVFRFSLFSVSVRFKLCSVLLIWIHRRNTRYFFGILGNNSLLLESNELPRCFFYY